MAEKKKIKKDHVKVFEKELNKKLKRELNAFYGATIKDDKCQFKSYAINDVILIDLLFSSDYKKRLIGEYWLNHIRLERLRDTLAQMEYDHKIGTEKYSILKSQYGHMRGYEDCLIYRSKMENINLHNTYKEGYKQ